MKEKIKKLADYVSLLKEKQDIGFEWNNLWNSQEN